MLSKTLAGEWLHAIRTARESLRSFTLCPSHMLLFVISKDTFVSSFAHEANDCDRVGTSVQQVA
jgi:hypothetical protein